jgi:hypothetical protein
MMESQEEEVLGLRQLERFEAEQGLPRKIEWRAGFGDEQPPQFFVAVGRRIHQPLDVNARHARRRALANGENSSAGYCSDF